MPTNTRLAPLCFELGRLMRRQLSQGGGTQASLLHIETLRFIEERNQPSMTELSRYLHVSKPTATALIDGLSREGFVRRVFDLKDRRLIRVALSQKGKRFLFASVRRKQEALARLFAPLTREDQHRLARILSKVTRSATN